MEILKVYKYLRSISAKKSLLTKKAAIKSHAFGIKKT